MLQQSQLLLLLPVQADILMTFHGVRTFIEMKILHAKTNALGVFRYNRVSVGYLDLLRMRKKRSVSDAFSENRSLVLGECTHKRPWLGSKNKDPDQCKHANQVRAIQRGATNGWFPLVRSALSIKEAASPIGQALKKCPQHQVEKIDSPEKLQTLLDMEMFPTLSEFKAEDIWQTLEKERGNIETDEIDLRLPEWQAFRDIDGSNQGDQSDFF